MRLGHSHWLLVLLLGIVVVSGCIQQEGPTKAPTPSQPSEVAAVTPQETGTQSELLLKVGEIAKTSKVEVTVLSARRVQSYEYYADILGYNVTKEAGPGKIFVLAETEIKSISDRVFVGSTEFSVTDSAGYKYDPTLYYGTDSLEMIKELFQDQKTRGKVVFEVPETAQDLKMQYDFGNLLIGTKLASWTLQ